jgi:hypothetical protein
MSDKITKLTENDDYTGKNIIDIIADKKLGIKTVETQNSDRLDFHDLSVASIKDALETAFQAGIEIGLTLNKGALR